MTACLYMAQRVLIPLALAVVLTFVLNPMVAALQRRGLWRVPAVIVVVLFAFLLLGGVCWALVAQMDRLVVHLPEYRKDIAQKMEHLRAVAKGLPFGEVQGLIKDIAKGNNTDTEEPAQSATPDRVVQVETWSASWIEKLIGSALEFFISAGFVIILVIFMLVQREDLRNRLVRLFGQGRLISTTRAFEDGAQRLSRFLIVQLTINAGFGIVLGLGLLLIGFPYAPLWAILGALLRYLPYVGTLVTTAIIVFLGVAIFPGWTQPLLALILLAGLELLVANVVEPLLFGHSSGLSPVALLIAAAFWTWLWGPIGLVLSTPLTACLVVLGRFVPRLEFLRVLLSDELALESEITYYQRLLAHDQDEAFDLVEDHLQSLPAESVCDSVLVPALILAKRDSQRGALTSEDERFILDTTREILDELVWASQESAAGHDERHHVEPSEKAKAVVLAYPAHDSFDELTLHMLSRLLEPMVCFKVLSNDTLVAELLCQIEPEQPAMVFIASLSASGLAHTSYVCKRLRAQFPTLKILVGRWGLTENVERVRQTLQSAGVDFVVTTLTEARAQMEPLVQALRHVRATKATA
jgi:predicted PurR-regulated permease PerM